MRRSTAPFFIAALCFAQGSWQTATTLPGVDLSDLPKASRDAALAVMRGESCTCGCDMKIAECRIGDPSCGDSRRLANFVAKEASSGKAVSVIRASLKKFAAEPPPVLDQPVKLSVEGDPVRGPANAPVTLVEFSDFQCPFCAHAVSEVGQILKKYPKDVRLVFKQFPLDSHAQAGLAAEAALAAQAQGKFWEMHDKMYANFRQINRDRILVWAKETGLDTKRFTSELDSHKYASRVQSEERQGEDAGVDGTPTFFLNGKKYNGLFEASALAPLIDKELKR